MIVTWVAIQSQPLPWQEERTDLAYVACGEKAGELCVVRTEAEPKSAAIERLLDSLETAVEQKRVDTGTPSLDWLRKAIPDQGTSIRLSSPRTCQASSYEEQVSRLALTGRRKS